MNRKFSIGNALAQSWPSRINERQLVLLVLGISLGMRLLGMWRVGIIGTDGLVFSQIATEILEGRWLQSNRTLLFNPYPASIALLHAWTGISLESAGKLLNSLLGGLAVLPLYYWTRDAFGRRIAVISAWVYAIHPMLIRYSAPMMRDGMYWYFMLGAIQLHWSALQRGGVWRYLLSGMCVTAAALIRTEGIALYLLFVLWSVCLSRFPRETRISIFFRGCGLGVSGAVFPAALLILNLTILPRDEPFSGLERVGFISPEVSSWISGIKVRLIPAEAPPAGTPSPPVATGETGEIKLVSAELQPTSLEQPVAAPVPVDMIHAMEAAPSPRSLQQLMEMIPAWSVRGDNMDPEGYALRRFLMLADENRSILYGSLFFRQVLHGFRIPVLICFVIGLCFGGRLVRLGRDLPLLAYAAVLLGFLWLHLTKTNVLESRYLVSVIPFLFPWTAWGISVVLVLSRQRWKRTRLEAWLTPKRILATSLIVSGVMVFWALRLTRDEAFQRYVAEIMKQESPSTVGRIVGSGSFARSGYYANLPYTKLPPHPEVAWNLISRLQPSFILLRPEGESPANSLVQRIDQTPQFERIKLSHPRFENYLVYRQRPVVQTQNVIGSAE